MNSNFDTHKNQLWLYDTYNFPKEFFAMFCHLAVLIKLCGRQGKRSKVYAKQKGFKNFFILPTFAFQNLRQLFDKYAVVRTEHDALVKSTTKIFFKFSGLLRKSKL